MGNSLSDPKDLLIPFPGPNLIMARPDHFRIADHSGSVAPAQPKLFIQD
jgi:hypothetical protein